MRLTANLEDRTITGLMLPFGEKGRTNVGGVTASSEHLPVFASDITLNLEHEATRPLGRIVGLPEVTNEGILGTFSVAETTAGNDLLAEVAAGLRTGLSVEIESPVIRAGRLLSGTLTACAAVVAPAFDSARVMTAADAGDLPDHMADTDSSTVSTEEIVIDGKTYVRKTTSTHTSETTPKDQTDGDQEAEQSAESENTVTNSLTASAPVGLHAGTTTAKPSEHSPDEVYRMLASAFKSGGQPKLQAALANVVHDDGDNDGDGLGEITAAPGWLGNVWNEAPYERQFIPLIASGNLTSYREKGFRWGTKPKVQKYSGNKAEVPTGGMTASPVDYITERWAHAADLDRRYVDFGDSDVIRAFIEAQAESYKEETDLDTAANILDNAEGFTPGTVPSGVSKTLAALVDGLLQLISNRLNPSFALLGVDLYRPFLFLTKDEVSAFLTESYGLKKGLLENVAILPTGLPDYAGQLVVGDGRTVRFKELGGGAPIRVEAEHLSHGGRDLGVFGYTSFQVLKPGGVIKTRLAPAPPVTP